MMGDEDSQLLEFLKAEEKRGDLCSLTDASGQPNQSPQICTNRALSMPTASGTECATFI